jgi:hypothetical protein
MSETITLQFGRWALSVEETAAVLGRRPSTDRLSS